MQILSRLFGLDSTAPRTSSASRPRRTNRAQFRLEALEDRDLKSNIPGVSVGYGELRIDATQAYGNSAHVSINPANNNLVVSLNGNTEEIDSSSVYSITFNGSQGGWDSFTNDTGVADAINVYGGHNTLAGGSSWNSVVMNGDNNSFDSRGGASYVFAYNGPNDIIPTYGNEYVYQSNFDVSFYY